MMSLTKFFKNPVATIRERMADYRSIQEEFDRINGSRISTLLDLSSSFYDADKKSFMPKGFLGEVFFSFANNTENLLNSYSYHDEISRFFLPVSLLNTQTRKIFDSVFSSVEPHPPHLSCFYVGDFLGVLNESMNLQGNLKIAAAIGEGPDVMEIFKSIRTAPDYSHHFPNRPPRNGTGKKNEERQESPGFLPGRLQPGGLSL